MNIIVYIIPFVTAIILFLFFRKRVVWWEYIVLIIPSILFTVLVKWIMVETNSSDIEYLGTYVNQITYYEPWNELVEVRHEEEYVSAWVEKEGRLEAQKVENFTEKARLVNLEKSNKYNLTQDLAKAFEVHCKYKYHYDENMNLIKSTFDKDGDGILYTLTRTDNVSVLSISNYLDFKNLIKSRVTSSLNDKEIVFPPYGANQLSDILSERAELSFNENVLEDDVIPLCSAMAAKEEGDARYALDLLKNAGELAFDNDCKKVTSEHVKQAKDRIEHNKISEIISTLPIQQQRVLEAILLLTKQKCNFLIGIYPCFALD